MSSRPRQPAPRPAPRFYLAPPPVAETAQIASTIAGLLGKADIAAVLLRLLPADERTLTNRVKAICPPIQALGVAVIIENHPEIVARSGADGCHLSDIAALEAAVPSIKPQRILGAGGLVTRHDAMSAGELGADYVMFGEPDGNGERPSFAAVIERISWWAEVFEIPCVAWAEQLPEVEELCAAGADFIALGDAVFADPRGAATALAEAASRLMARTPA